MQSLDDDEVLYNATSFTRKVLKNALYVESVVSKLRDCDFKSHFRLISQTVEVITYFIRISVISIDFYFSNRSLM